jgi:polyketide biosynthesis enoyl-CoA hydratase PksI
MSDEVVTLAEPELGVGLITLQDRRHRNSLTRELTAGLFAAYRRIAEEGRFSAVIITGYDTYFSTGGTLEDLLVLQEGKHFFDEIDVMRPALNCDVPVISAMQGHALGGGLAMGLFADFVVLSRESVYSASFMKFGFTPGMGATYILPKRLGFNIGYEMLMNGDDFLGADLLSRGVSLPVLPRKEVLPYALSLARGLAEKPRASLAALKSHMGRSIKAELDETVRLEIEMHQKTMPLPAVRKKIEELFSTVTRQTGQGK